MKKFLKTLVVVIAVIIVAKTGIGYAQDYICTRIEDNIETQMNESFAEETNGYFEAHANVEFTSPLTLEMETVVYDWFGNVWYSDCETLDLVDYL